MSARSLTRGAREEHLRERDGPQESEGFACDCRLPPARRRPPHRNRVTPRLNTRPLTVKVHVTHADPSQLTLSVNMPPQYTGEPTCEGVFGDRQATTGTELELRLPVGFVGDEAVNGV